MIKENQIPENLVAGRNPVMELLRSDRDTDKILMLKDAGGSLQKIAAIAKERGIPVKEVTAENCEDTTVMDFLSGNFGERSFVLFTRAEIYSGVVPQHPPTTVAPSQNSTDISSANSSVETSYTVLPPLIVGRPAFGFIITGNEERSI